MCTQTHQNKAAQHFFTKPMNSACNLIQIGTSNFAQSQKIETIARKIARKKALQRNSSEFSIS